MAQKDRWTGVANGIATIVVGFVLFGVGVVYGLGPIEILSALVIVAGGVALVVALLRADRPPS